MAKAGYLGFPVSAISVADGHLDDFEIEFCRTENQIEIAERVEDSEVRAPSLEPLVVRSRQHLGSAECVGEPLAEQPCEDHGEQLVRNQVERPHCLIFHPIDKP